MTTCILALTLGSCNSVIYEDLPECVPQYNFRIAFDHNTTGTDKTDEVEAAEIYAFDSNGMLAAISKADKQTLIDNNYTLPIKLEQNKTYDVVLWGGLTANSPFKLDGTRAVASKEDLTCRLDVERDENGNAFSKKELPHLFHGAGTYTFTAEDGYEEQTISLVKNTNLLNVILRNEDGSPIKDDEYVIKVTDNNGVMGHDNAVIPDEVIHYHPVAVTAGDFDTTDGNGNFTGSSSKGAKADIHLLRLMADADARLMIADKAGNIKANLPLIALLLQTKGRSTRDSMIDDQEFLDRQYEYMTEITLPSDDEWLHLSIHINGWVVVIQNFEW